MNKKILTTGLIVGTLLMTFPQITDAAKANTLPATPSVQDESKWFYLSADDKYG